MREVAQDKIDRLGRPGVSTIPFDLLNDPPPSPPFDLAISLLVLHHLPEPRAALAALHALLRPGGRLALSDLDTEDGNFHDEEAEGVFHLGFDRDELERIAARGRASRTSGWRRRPRRVNERGDYPLFLLTARRP